MTRAEVRAKLFQSFIKSTFNFKVVLAFVLCVLLVLSAFMVVIVKYQYKTALDEEQRLFSQRENLRDQWTQILIEHSTLASPSHVEEVAKENNMHLPTVKETRVIQVNG
ncbi:cell division protein FtsL [Fastidiosibacter lacustris]|uniref:cell division protein FtsL n=1 Tax=Fastidiosibacter lacustris TaxID=2056695 RepID=UPI000E3483B2|nr:cell division protein FtsL [Fastidiosibacter lacustris]